MAAFDLLGFLLTALSLGLLGLGGYLLALRLLGWPLPDDERHQGADEQKTTDPLTFAVAALLLTLAEAIAGALVLGALGLLRLELALALQTGLVLVLYRSIVRRVDGGTGSPDEAGAGSPGEAGAGPVDLMAPARLVLRRSWSRLRESPVLALVTLHAAGTEILRGLLVPPVSWDSIMYHVFLAATWLQRHHFGPFPARHPMSFYELMPANGSLWLWWWMAPSHSELYLGLASALEWLLLGLAVGAFARTLGARRHWPIASFLTLLTPTVVRFVAAQYVDIAVGAFLVSGTYFAVRWLRTPRASDAALVGTAAGLAAGTKVLALPSAGALGLFTLVLAVPAFRGDWRRRVGHLALMAVLAAALGGYFYARNLSLGGGLFGYACASQDASVAGSALGTFPSARSPAANVRQLVAGHEITGAFLGVVRPTMVELGVGPQSLLLLPILLLLPWLFRGERRTAAWLSWGQIGVMAVIWWTLTSATHGHIFANIRYLIGGIGLLFAAAVALGERHLPTPWLRGLAIVLAIQDLLMLNPRMSYPVRVTLAVALAGAVAVAALPSLRRRLVEHRRWVALAVALAVLVAVPFWAAYRVRDRERAFTEDYIAHLASTRLFAAGWGWLDRHGGTGTVAVSHTPETYFVYPAMGPYLERRAVYVNINRENLPYPLLYPNCKPRVDPSAAAWIDNLRAAGVRWVYVARYPEFKFPVEDTWAEQRPELFALRFEDQTNRVYELLH